MPWGGKYGLDTTVGNQYGTSFVPEKKKSFMRSKLKRAGWNNNNLLKIILGAKLQLNEDEKVQKR